MYSNLVQRKERRTEHPHNSWSEKKKQNKKRWILEGSLHSFKLSAKTAPGLFVILRLSSLPWVSVWKPEQILSVPLPCRTACGVWLYRVKGFSQRRCRPKQRDVKWVLIPNARCWGGRSAAAGLEVTSSWRLRAVDYFSLFLLHRNQRPCPVPQCYSTCTYSTRFLVPFVVVCRMAAVLLLQCFAFAMIAGPVFSPEALILIRNSPVCSSQSLSR